LLRRQRFNHRARRQIFKLERQLKVFWQGREKAAPSFNDPLLHSCLSFTGGQLFPTNSFIARNGGGPGVRLRK
jgi:hypothetical protein